MVTTRMRVFGVGLAGLLVLLFLPFTMVMLPVAARADTTEQQIHNIDATLGDALQSATFIQANSIDAFVSEFPVQYPALSQALKQAVSDYQATGSAASGQIKTYADQLAGETGDMSAALDQIAVAVSSQSSNELQTGVTGFQSAVHQYLATADSYNSYIKANPGVDHPLLAVFLVLFIVSLLVTAGALAFWLMAKAPPGDVVADRIKALRIRLVLVSLVPVAGSGITYFWYRHAISSGGQYFVLWGPVAFGFLAFGSWANRYRTTVARLRAQPPAVPVPFAYPAPPGSYPAPPGYGYPGPGPYGGPPNQEGGQ